MSHSTFTVLETRLDVQESDRIFCHNSATVDPYHVLKYILVTYISKKKEEGTLESRFGGDSGQSTIG